MSDSDQNDDEAPDSNGLNAPGLTDLPLRLSRALGQAAEGPMRVLSSGVFGLARAAQNLGLQDGTDNTADDRTGERLGRSGQSLTKAAGQAILETARVVEDTAERFLQPHGPHFPKMVRTGSEFYPFAPFLIENASVYACAMDADMEKLRAYLTKTFTAPTYGAVDLVPACAKVVLFIARNEKLQSKSDAEPIRKGFLADDRDVAIWVPAFRRNAPSPSKLVYFVPIYHFVTHGPSLAAGREIHGFPKQQGGVTSTAPLIDPDPGTGDIQVPNATAIFDVKTWTLKSADENEEIVSRRVLRVRATEDLVLSPSATSLHQFVQQLMGEFVSSNIFKGDLVGKQAAEVLKLMGIDINDLGAFRGRIPTIFLKQVPSVEDSTRCAYQAVVESNLEITRLGAHGLVKKNASFISIELPKPANAPAYATHRFDDLGLDMDAPQLLHRLLWLNADIRVNHGKVLWSWP